MQLKISETQLLEGKLPFPLFSNVSCTVINKRQRPTLCSKLQLGKEPVLPLAASKIPRFLYYSLIDTTIKYHYRTIKLETILF